MEYGIAMPRWWLYGQIIPIMVELLLAQVTCAMWFWGDSFLQISPRFRVHFQSGLHPILIEIIGLHTFWNLDYTLSKHSDDTTRLALGVPLEILRKYQQDLTWRIWPRYYPVFIQCLYCTKCSSLYPHIMLADGDSLMWNTLSGCRGWLLRYSNHLAPCENSSAIHDTLYMCKCFPMDHAYSQANYQGPHIGSLKPCLYGDIGLLRTEWPWHTCFTNGVIKCPRVWQKTEVAFSYLQPINQLTARCEIKMKSIHVLGLV